MNDTLNPCVARKYSLIMENYMKGALLDLPIINQSVMLLHHIHLNSFACDQQFLFQDNNELNWV